jgi:hypothetical protein
VDEYHVRVKIGSPIARSPTHREQAGRVLLDFLAYAAVKADRQSTTAMNPRQYVRILTAVSKYPSAASGMETCRKLSPNTATPRSGMEEVASARRPKINPTALSAVTRPDFLS